MLAREDSNQYLSDCLAFSAKKARQAAVYWLQRKSAKHLSGVKAPKFEPESNLKK